jgi:hypothetical protein
VGYFLSSSAIPLTWTLSFSLQLPLAKTLFFPSPAGYTPSTFVGIAIKANSFYFHLHCQGC